MITIDLKSIRMKEWQDSLVTGHKTGDSLRDSMKKYIPSNRDEAALLLQDLDRLAFTSNIPQPVKLDVASIVTICAEAAAKLPNNSRNKVMADADYSAAVALHKNLLATGFGRQLAGDPGVWMWLNLVVPDWALERWKGSSERGSNYEQWFGSPFSNALGRLFWVAELMRDGEDYSAARGAFLQQNVVNDISQELYRSRHWAIALGSLAADFDGSGGSATDKEWKIVTKVADQLAFLNRPEASSLNEEQYDFGDDDPVIAYQADPVAISAIRLLLGKYLSEISELRRLKGNKLYFPDGSR